MKYYQDELEFLVENGKLLAKKHPKIAKTLDFSSFGSNDGDVQRLIESVAFLNAKLQKRLDEQAPEISNAIINALYPQFGSPIPSCMIVNFEHINKVDAQKFIPRGTLLTSSKTHNGQYYTFATTMDAYVTNYKIEDIYFVKTANAHSHSNTAATASLPYSIYAVCDNALCLKLYNPNFNQKFDKKYQMEGEKSGTKSALLSNATNNSTNDVTSSLMELTFYIHMIDGVALNVYEAIMSVFPNKNTPIFENGVKIGEIEPVGFEDDQSIFFNTKVNNSGYRILLEYTTFHKKFLFFRAKFTQAPQAEIVIPFNSKKEIYIKNGDILLNCVPAINLFEKNSEPINVNQKNTYYAVKADGSLHKTTAVHSILEIADTNFDDEQKTKYVPYFSAQHLLDTGKHYVFWLAKSSYSKTLADQCDTSISLLDTRPALDSKVLYAKLLCYQSNAQYIQPDESWNIAKTPGNLRCKNLDNPTSVVMPPMHSRSQWRLISHLAVNYFWFDDEHALDNLKELLSIYDFGSSVEISGKNSACNALMKMKYGTKMRAYKGCILPVIEIEITADESKSEVFLLASILKKFFESNANFNTRINFILKRNANDSVWKSEVAK